MLFFANFNFKFAIAKLDGFKIVTIASVKALFVRQTDGHARVKCCSNGFYHIGIPSVDHQVGILEAVTGFVTPINEYHTVVRFVQLKAAGAQPTGIVSDDACQQGGGRCVDWLCTRFCQYITRHQVLLDTGEEQGIVAVFFYLTEQIDEGVSADQVCRQQKPERIVLTGQGKALFTAVIQYA